MPTKFTVPTRLNRDDKTKKKLDETVSGTKNTKTNSTNSQRITTRTGFTNSNRQRKVNYVGEGKDFEVKKGDMKDEGYPHSTNPTSQPKAKSSSSKTRGTIEEREKARTRSVLEEAFVGNNTRSAPPSKEEQERMRKQGARNAANMYGRNYSGRRG